MLQKTSGLWLAGLMGWLALLVGSRIPLLGASLFALFSGLLLSGLLQGQSSLQPGLTLASKKGLQYAIILLGFRLSFADIQAVGLASYAISIPLLALAFGLSFWLGGRLGLSKRLGLLVAFGTAICGGSAIASAAPILEAEEEEVGLALTTIFLYNLIGLVAFPLLGQLLNLSQEAFGIWAGTAINDTSSVVAAAYGYGQQAGDTATVVKLARTLLIVPSCLVFSLGRLGGQTEGSQGRVSLAQLFPTFVLWFLLASALTSFKLIPAEVLAISKPLSQWLMATSLFAVGSKMSLKQLRQAGSGPVLLGGLIWLSLSAVSLVLQLI